MAIGHDEEPRIVGYEGPASPALFSRPPNELVSILYVESRGTPGGHGQPSAFVDEGITEMLPDQVHIMQVVVFNNDLIAPGDVLW
jgi:hypothetical protein